MDTLHKLGELFERLNTLLYWLPWPTRIRQVWHEAGFTRLIDIYREHASHTSDHTTVEFRIGTGDPDGLLRLRNFGPKSYRTTDRLLHGYKLPPLYTAVVAVTNYDLVVKETKMNPNSEVVRILAATLKQLGQKHDTVTTIKILETT